MKRFLRPEAVLLHCEWVKKHFLCRKELPQKIKAVNFGCRKRFLRPEAVLLHCEWAKKRFLRRKELLLVFL